MGMRREKKNNGQMNRKSEQRSRSVEKLQGRGEKRIERRLREHNHANLQLFPLLLLDPPVECIVCKREGGDVLALRPESNGDREEKTYMKNVALMF